ncbi:MAG: hypothetical protein JWO09_2772 [Bacteroidetes bacterium]|nr:hypothetical protein [Bacteroidota bacterium]
MANNTYPNTATRISIQLCFAVFIIIGSLYACSDRPIKNKDETPPVAAPAGATQSLPEMLYGQWKITHYTGGNITAITDEQAKEYVGKQMLLGSAMAVILGDSCKSPSYESHKEKAGPYFYANYKVDKKLLDLEEDEVQVVSLTCRTKPVYSKEDSPNFNFDLIIKDKTTVIVAINGFFFYFEKI